MKKIRPILIALLGFTFSMCLASPSFAGPVWQVTLHNNGLTNAAFVGNQDPSCWYTNQFTMPFEVPQGSTLKFTEENWNIFSCFNDSNFVRLNFTLINGGTMGAFAIFLADLGTGAATPPNAYICTMNGLGEQAAVGWAWTDGNSHPNPGSVSCTQGNGAVYVSITLPSP